MPFYIVSLQVFSLKHISEIIQYHKMLHLKLVLWIIPASLCQNSLNDTVEKTEKGVV